MNDDDGLSCDECGDLMFLSQDHWIPTRDGVDTFVEEFECNCGATMARISEYDEQGTTIDMYADFDETTSNVWKARRENW